MVSEEDHLATVRKAQRYLSRQDPVMGELIRQYGACSLRPHPDRLMVLVRAIVWQQLSTKAAESIHRRLLAQLPRERLSARGLFRLTEVQMRAAGLSRAKVKALQDLSTRVCRRQLPLSRLHELEDEAVIEALIEVWGIGRWTAQMFLMFSLGRPDVLPVGDLGLQMGVKRRYGLRKVPKREKLERLAEAWRPYRSIATWYLWRSLGGVPATVDGQP
jgi:DNA-3-methyladenine glycosylase II